MVVELDLREHERGEQEHRHGRGRTGPADERHERDQPDQVLRRERLPEGHVDGDGRDHRGDDALDVGRTAGERPCSPGDEHDDGDQAQARDGARQRPEQVERAGLPRSRRSVVEAEPVGGKEERSTEALGLKVAGELDREAEAEAARPERREREEQHEPCGDEGAQGAPQPVPPLDPPDPDRGRGDGGAPGTPSWRRRPRAARAPRRSAHERAERARPR